MSEQETIKQEQAISALMRANRALERAFNMEEGESEDE